MQGVRTGLFWGSVIQEIPKLQYNSHYAILNIMPFFFYWISFLLLPCFLLIKDKQKLKQINKVCIYIVYFPFSLVLLAVFMAVNAALIPFAYIKTVTHKFILLKTYRSAVHLKNLAIYIFMGVPFLLVAQFTDAVRFIRHSYSNKQRQQTDKFYKLRISLVEFNKFNRYIKKKLDKGVTDMNAIKFIKKMREQHHVMDNISGYLFGVQAASLKTINSHREKGGKEQGDTLQSPEKM